MRRIFSQYAYASGPREGCWWDETVQSISHPALAGGIRCDVVVVGGGFTGLSAALHLARRGAQVVVLEANSIGWGASGRNGGFCCLGGSMRSDMALDRRYGHAARRDWRTTERVAVERVEALIADLSLDVDRHSKGETCLAHRPRDFRAFEDEARAASENYGVIVDVLSSSELELAGLSGPFHGAITNPIGFGLNPRKLIDGLVEACLELGVVIHDNSPAVRITSGEVKTPNGVVRAEQIVVATNGYSSEDIPNWMASRCMPAQSTAIVTRPLTEAELQRQGWTSDQMAYDTRHLLHYFRLMPDRRFLFGMRGGLLCGPSAERQARSAVVHSFRTMFPAWSHVDVTHAWSGLVCLTRDRVPFVGPVPGMSGILAGFAYHGNGVAMGVHAGSILAALASNEQPDHHPEVMSTPATRFPFGSFRRLIMPGVYTGFRVSDALP
ncbi:FAD-binding oxidoreductase [uncultured Tateyamaria sp.]|uniref:NAD(P)/FAD-dependent oxidoreductase n=1 Tax=uncultured Tateyamaria sp. TaxID=455651 RepID=UPI00262E3496|nr:FAD-binding oxidoreductase [uncultured Tateyamaria sp.]